MGLIKFVMIGLALSTSAAFAAVQDWNVRYYAGTLNILDKKTNAVYQEKVVMYHVNSPERDMAMQMACVKDAGKPAYLVPTYIMRQLGGQMTVSDREEFSQNSQLTGQAQASGQEWFWDRYTLDMKYRYSNKPNDFVTMKAHLKFVPGGLRVAKRVWYANGQPKHDWSGTLPEVSKEHWLKAASALKCPAIP